MPKRFVCLTKLAYLFVAMSVPLEPQVTSIGIFEDQGDIGLVLHSGSAIYDSASQSYTVTGSGENMWLKTDQFHFVWKKVSGDVSLTADVSILGAGGNAHRKAALVLRQNLDPDSPYADVALHGSGLTALQFRDSKGEITQEIQASQWAPKRLQIVKRGNYVYMALLGKSGQLELAGGWVRVPIEATYYVGLGVCAHDKDAIEKAVFSHVELKALSQPTHQPTLYSTLETVPVASGDRQVVYLTEGRIESPNWTHDGRSFLFNSDGRIRHLSPTEGGPETVETGFATHCNNDHGISPDGAQLAISDQSQEDHLSLIYVLPSGGGAPRRVTQNAPSYWHGWSPDGKTLAYVGQRQGGSNIYIVPAVGGDETRLTNGNGFDDGPDYSPDGKYIYFNSQRTGSMQIWRMNADGSQPQRVTFDEFNDWFPHISPDGLWMVFLSYDREVSGHPENKDVVLRLMSLTDRKVKILAKLFGGQGTMNVPSWSPDSKQIAFISYQPIP